MNLRDELSLYESYSHAALAAYIFACGPFGIWVGSLGYDKRPLVSTMKCYKPMPLPGVAYDKGWADSVMTETFAGDIGATVEWMICECGDESELWLDEEEGFFFVAKEGRWKRIV